MINLIHMTSILNSIFTVVFYVTRWTKLDTAFICFEEFINQLNLLYISIYLYLQKDKIYGMRELGYGSNFFIGPSLAQWAASEKIIIDSLSSDIWSRNGGNTSRRD
jgi:hypothetical protein